MKKKQCLVMLEELKTKLDLLEEKVEHRIHREKSRTVEELVQHERTLKRKLGYAELARVQQGANKTKVS